jgi:ribosomal protein L14E/L6E/L27E
MPDEQTIDLWRLVTSRAGRDFGQAYLVCEVGQDGFVALVDGERRRLEAPKRKNAKHLVAYDLRAEDIVAKADAGLSIKNSEVRTALQQLKVAAGLSGDMPPTDSQ